MIEILQQTKANLLHLSQKLEAHVNPSYRWTTSELNSDSTDYAIHLNGGVWLPQRCDQQLETMRKIRFGFLLFKQDKREQHRLHFSSIH